MKQIATGWGTWTVGVGLVMALDYLTRMQVGDLRSGGLPAPVAGTLLAVAAALAAWQFLAGTRPLGAMWLRLVVVGVQIVVAVALAIFANIFYVVTAGIDAL
jgi:hypothetical protein